MHGTHSFSIVSTVMQRAVDHRDIQTAAREVVMHQGWIDQIITYIRDWLTDGAYSRERGAQADAVVNDTLHAMGKMVADMSKQTLRRDGSYPVRQYSVNNRTLRFEQTRTGLVIEDLSGGGRSGNRLVLPGQTMQSLASHLILSSLDTACMSVSDVGIDFCLTDVDFSNRTLSRADVERIQRDDGSLIGATLRTDFDGRELDLGELRIDTAMAQMLIDAGANVTDVVAQLIATDRAYGRPLTDLTSLDLVDLDPDQMRFEGTVINFAQCQAMFRKGAAPNGAVLAAPTTGTEYRSLDMGVVPITLAFAKQLIFCGANEAQVMQQYVRSATGNSFDDFGKIKLIGRSAPVLRTLPDDEDRIDG